MAITTSRSDPRERLTHGTNTSLEESLQGRVPAEAKVAAGPFVWGPPEA